jgi:hypothetical protein
MFLLSRTAIASSNPPPVLTKILFSLLFDTGDYYAAGHNELSIREALRERDGDAVALNRSASAFPTPHRSRHPSSRTSDPVGMTSNSLAARCTRKCGSSVVAHAVWRSAIAS